jgi:hypothetical protein
MMGADTAATAGDVAAKLQQAGIDSAAAGNLQQLGAGSAAMVGGLGASTASRLISQGAAAQTEMAGLPTIATLQGTRSARLANSEINAGKSEALGDLQAQLPGETSKLIQALRNTEIDKAIARNAYDTDVTKAAATAMGDVDYSWRSGPSSQKYVTDPSTGEQYNNPNYIAKGAKGANGAQQRRIDATIKDATKLARTLVTPDPLKGRTTPTLNTQAYAQVTALIQSRHPGLGIEQIATMAENALAAGGYLKAKIHDPRAGYRAWLNGTLASQQPASAGRPATSARPSGKPTAQTPTPAAPQDVVERNPVVTANAAASQKAETAARAKRAQAESRGSRVATAYVRQMRSQAEQTPVNKRVPYLTVKKNVIAQLQRAMPGHPYKRIIALANEAMAEYPSRYAGG